ncbi:unnamed protein product [Adineta steineri]|uniref:NmrA-like family domain-containing protein 1 n=1 Tax=Adineta steineri TaxID=433720 RepID=A0A814X0G0_9BILA|nr:unnamed protein product [Adineta steineri]CAF1485386.1 unnamed protein product [Adineta steineri]
MVDARLITVVGATGAQGSAVVRALVETGKYKIRGLTRDSSSEKAQILKRLSDNIDMVTCDITKSDDVERAFKDSWAIFAVTDPWTNPNQLELEKQQGYIMADIVSRYHYKKCRSLKTIYVELAMYMQNWRNAGKLPKIDDGTVIFAAPIDEKVQLHLVDIDDIGPIVREILADPDKFVGQDICVCGDEISLENLSKIFTKVTGIPAISKTLTEEEFRTITKQLPKTAQDNIFGMHKWIEEYGYYGKDKDWTNGQKLTKLNTFEQWLRKTGWEGK